MEQRLVINAAQFEFAKVSSDAVRKAVIAQFNRISTSPSACVDRPRSPRTRPGHVILPQQDERRLDLRCTFTDNQDPHRRDLCQLILPILPLSSRHYRYRPQGQGRRPKDYRRVPDLGRRRDVLHRARRAIRRHRRPVLEEGFIGNFMHPRPPDRDRVQRVTVCEIIAVVESRQGYAKGCRGGRETGRYPRRGPQGCRHHPRRVRGFFKQFKFLGRYALEQSLFILNGGGAGLASDFA